MRDHLFPCGLGSHLFRSTVFHAPFHPGERTDPKRDPGDADLFLLDLYDGAAVRGAVHLRGAEPSETGGILFTFPESDHRGAADHISSDDRRTRHRRRVPRRAGIQRDRRNGMLCHHALHCLAETGRERRTKKDIRLTVTDVFLSSIIKLSD